MLEAHALVKRYPGVTALDGVDFSVDSGEVVALIGENGAGKSTLIKILAGLIQPDEGELVLDGNLIHLGKASDATKLGIGVIHQELSNLDNLDIAGNVFLGREPLRFGFLLDEREMRRRTSTYLRALGLDLAPDTQLSSLSIAQQQMVEIAKALSLEARILVMDEPTSSLTASETEQLLAVIDDLRKRGVGIVYVSHRLDEVKRIADRAVVLRDGRYVGSLPREGITTENMVRMMVGRDIEKRAGRTAVNRKPRLVLKGLRTTRYPQYEITLDVGSGEIVGLAGLVGAGRTELAEAVFGVEPRLSGEVELDGVPVPASSPGGAIRAGLFLAPEDRRHEGLITAMSVRENVTLPSLSRFVSGGLIQRSKECAEAEKMLEKLRIKAPSVESEVSGLSGGNQQKVVLAKWLSLEPKCLVFDEPTRGIDVGARSEIYGLMQALSEQGVAILMISSDMEEILAMSDRIAVMHEGQLSGVIAREDASEEAIMSLAVGHA